MLTEYAQRTGVQCLGIDTGMDLRWAAGAVQPGQALQGNLDPQALIAGGMALEAEARSILGTMRGRPFIFNLGHGIEKVTPPEHVAALVRLVRTG
jgi:uroporphyrinogen decarboxylase